MHAACSLRDLQSRFLAALYDGDSAVAAAMVEGAGLDAQARVQVYRNSAALTHTDTLRTTYPAVLALVGDNFFESAAVQYRRAHPSTSGNLQDFGARFAEFIGALPNTYQLPYLADVARLEWLRQTVALAADATPLSAAAMQQASVPAQAHDKLCIALHPSVRLFASQHAVLTLWRYAMDPPAERLQLPTEGEHVVLWRSDTEVAMASVDAASFTCIEALSRGVSLDDACHEALIRDAQFDVTACIGSLVEQAVITAIHPVPEETLS